VSNADPVAVNGDGYARTGLPTDDCAPVSVTNHSRSEKKSNVTRLRATAPTLIYYLPRGSPSVYGRSSCAGMLLRAVQSMQITTLIHKTRQASRASRG
jgi:hypothetical protein